MPGNPAPRWHDAAASASFAPYELIEPVPVARRPGGFGYADFATVSSLDIEFDVPGGEVEVTTRLRDERLAAGYQQLLVHHVLSRLGFSALTLPVTIHLEETDRTVAVDGTAVTFRGVAVADQGIWSGWTLLPTCIVHINVKGAISEGLAIAVCCDLAAVPEAYG